MECLDTTKSLKINFKRNIGSVLIVVEGASYEFDLLKQIFKKFFITIILKKAEINKILKTMMNL